MDFCTCISVHSSSLEKNHQENFHPGPSITFFILYPSSWTRTLDARRTWCASCQFWVTIITCAATQLILDLGISSHLNRGGVWWSDPEVRMDVRKDQQGLAAVDEWTWKYTHGYLEGPLPGLLKVTYDMDIYLYISVYDDMQITTLATRIWWINPRLNLDDTPGLQEIIFLVHHTRRLFSLCDWTIAIGYPPCDRVCYYTCEICPVWGINIDIRRVLMFPV